MAEGIDRRCSVYFGYGSNMWLDQMVRRCPESNYLGIAYFVDWKWIINEKGYATIVQSLGDRVYGLVYDISESDERALDGYEGVPVNYAKKYYPVVFLGKKGEPEEREIEVLIYIDVERTKEGPPKPEYIHRMNEAIADAEKEGVPEAYVEKYLRPFIPKE
ncbi:hypothetical protein P691DRAFT_705755 [Macrolepiota fuliginosa MF-IS2]|uniref:gamma-glutamylcyclotransferase n=1 Tax=Macrolepiota fuliginosa MF-IS2 TaxID=1400762 RepID=A0A9P5XDB9_9AGAR|nr:hypothetical protein P691DRAFT_705755 [Macrolepiota fuliginosa MF-IS2]